MLTSAYLSLITFTMAISILSCLLIILAYILIPSLRQSQIFLYEQIIKTLQAIGIELCYFYHSNEILCHYFGNFRIYFSFSSLLFSLIYLHQIMVQINSFQKISENQLEKLIIKKYSPFKSINSLYLTIGFGIPFLLIQIPLWANLISSQDDFCYIYPQDDQLRIDFILSFILGILVWDLPLVLYCFYSVWLVKITYQLFESADCNKGLQIVIRRFYQKFFTTLMIVIPFTIIYNLQMFLNESIPQWSYMLSLAILNLWSTIDCIYFWLIKSDIRMEFLIKSGLKKKLKKSQILINESSFIMQHRESGEEFFYKADEAVVDSSEFQKMQNLISSVNKNQSASL